MTRAGHVSSGAMLANAMRVIQEGGTASAEFMRVTFGNVPAAERVKVRRQLEDYCALDTSAMVRIIEALRLALRPDAPRLRLPM